MVVIATAIAIGSFAIVSAGMAERLIFWVAFVGAVISVYFVDSSRIVVTDQLATILVDATAFGGGAVIALFLGTQTNRFLDRSVTATVPWAIKLPEKEENGGARQLGTLEILLYLTSFWFKEFVVAGAWLGLKMAAKWAAWQHIAKISDRREYGDIYLPLRERLQFANRLLGRFFNGNLFNVFCAAVGWGVARCVKKFYNELIELLPMSGFKFAILISLAVIFLTIWLLFVRLRTKENTPRRD